MVLRLFRLQAKGGFQTDCAYEHYIPQVAERWRGRNDGLIPLGSQKAALGTRVWYDKAELEDGIAETNSK